MSIDAKLDELIKALNRVADSNGALAQAYQAMAGAGDNGPKRGRAEAPAKPMPELPGEPLPATVSAPAAAQATGGATFQDVRAALLALPRERVTALLAKYGADKLSALDEAHYGALIAEARGGAQDPLL